MKRHLRVVEYGRPSAKQISSKIEKQWSEDRREGRRPESVRNMLNEPVEEKGVDELLAEGWLVVQMCPFSQHVSVSLGRSHPSECRSWDDTKLFGEYGVVYILEKDFPEEDTAVDEETAFDDE